MIIDFIKGNGGGGSGEDTRLRASAYTQSELTSANTLVFKTMAGSEAGSVDLSKYDTDLSDYYTKSQIDNTVSGITDNIDALGIQVSANTEAIAALSGQTSDATELQPKTAIPESGNAGTLIALNKPDEYGWTSNIIGSGKSRTQISYYVEPSDNPNPDLSLRPTRYEITVAYADSVDENGNYSYSNQTTVELSVDYQGNITFTNLGNFSQSGDIYSLVADIYNTSTGENIQKTLYMSLENGYLYFNNEQGDCPYDMGWTQYQYYWQDMGSWDESDPENPVWQESWTEMNNVVGFQSWGIANPAKIGIYQANSGGTYEDYLTKVPTPEEVKYAQRIKTYENGTDFDNIYFEEGDIISVQGWGRAGYVNQAGTGLNVNQFAYTSDVNSINEKVRDLDTTSAKVVKGVPYTPSETEGDVYADKNGGLRQVVSGATTSGWTCQYVKYGEMYAYSVFNIKYLDGRPHMDTQVSYNGADAGLRVQGIEGFDVNVWYMGWTLVTQSTNYYELSRDFNGETVVLTAELMQDGVNMLLTFDKPIDIRFGSWTDSQLGDEYDFYVTNKKKEINYVSSESVTKIWKGSQNDYDAITTKDANTVYIII